MEAVTSQIMPFKDLYDLCKSSGVVVKPLSCYTGEASGLVNNFRDVNNIASYTSEFANEVQNEVAKERIAVFQEQKSKKNPISALKEMCDKKNLEQAKYEFIAQDSSNWTCTVSVTGFGPGKDAVTATAFQKQQAKTLAAEKLIECIQNRKQNGQSFNPIFAQNTVRELTSEVQKVSYASLRGNSSQNTNFKSPIQLLFEYCRKIGDFPPVYFEDPVKDPKTGFFRTTVTVQNCTGTGLGKKKKESKDNASIDVLKKLEKVSKSNQLSEMLKTFGF